MPCFPTFTASGLIWPGSSPVGSARCWPSLGGLSRGPSCSYLTNHRPGKPKDGEQVFSKLREVRDSGVMVLLWNKNVKAALALADRTAVLVEGKERIVASSSELLTNDLLPSFILAAAWANRL